jgi:hypothetical protein
VNGFINCVLVDLVPVAIATVAAIALIIVAWP